MVFASSSSSLINHKRRDIRLRLSRGALKSTTLHRQREATEIAFPAQISFANNYLPFIADHPADGGLDNSHATMHHVCFNMLTKRRSWTCCRIDGRV
ncbi:hypothetical protein EYF80_043554 [Liparis tanakae]|uniref:Uncharacterized protein n=1 Tax=Liparis tanakae TaxID=230148 RepID=A0A4Z2FZ29_9TELE|nr:hypothetical protein EYF80_043554 [Liparis tanakae]